MRHFSHFGSPFAQRYLKSFVCILCLVIFADSSPIRRARVKSLSSPNPPTLAVLPRDKPDDTVIFHKKADRRQNLELDPVKRAGKKNADDHHQELVIEKPADFGARSSTTEENLALALQGSSPDKVGQLPAQLAIPPPAETTPDKDRDGKAGLPAVEVAGGVNMQDGNRNQEQGIAVGVGAMNRGIPTTNQSRQAQHQGPDSLLDVGAADRKDSNDKNPKDSALAVDRAGKLDQEVLNPALQQPPPQAREPPLDQLGAKETHLGPINPQEERRPMSGSRGNLQIIDRPANYEKVDSSMNKDVLRFDRNVIQMVKEPVKLSEIHPPDHVEGVRMEKDGHLNRDYRKEVFLGHHEEFEWTDQEKISAQLKAIFRRANKNGDKYLDENEMRDWIALNIRIHLQDAERENSHVFQHLDADKNGLVSWVEFFSHFLIAKGYIASSKDFTKNISLEPEDSEKVMKYRYRWSEASSNSNSEDDELNDREMMNFRHPEQSGRMISQMVKDLMDNLDRNGNGVISVLEFIALPHNLDGDAPLPMEENWQEERKKEFQDVIDLNKDGNADVAELKIYFDPNNLNHARLEAQNLLKMADNDSDGKLTMQEMLDNSDIFVESKMVDVKRKLHDEF